LVNKNLTLVSSHWLLKSQDGQHAYANIHIIQTVFTYSSCELLSVLINKTCLVAELTVHNFFCPFLMLVCFSIFLFGCVLADMGMWLHRCCILKNYISKVDTYKLFCVQVQNGINMPQLLVTYLLFYIL